MWINKANIHLKILSFLKLWRELTLAKVLQPFWIMHNFSFYHSLWSIWRAKFMYVFLLQLKTHHQPNSTMLVGERFWSRGWRIKWLMPKDGVPMACWSMECLFRQSSGFRRFRITWSAKFIDRSCVRKQFVSCETLVAGIDSTGFPAIFHPTHVFCYCFVHWIFLVAQIFLLFRFDYELVACWCWVHIWKCLLLYRTHVYAIIWLIWDSWVILGCAFKVEFKIFSIFNFTIGTKDKFKTFFKRWQTLNELQAIAIDAENIESLKLILTPQKRERSAKIHI